MSQSEAQREHKLTKRGVRPSESEGEGVGSKNDRTVPKQGLPQRSREDD